MGKRSRERRKADMAARAAHGGAGTKPNARPNARAGRDATDRSGAGAAAASGGGRRGSRQRPTTADHLATAELLVADAMTAHHAGAAEEYAAFVQALVDGPGGADGHRVVSRALAVWFDRIVESLWTGGWQPADVVRVIGRELGSGHTRMTLDAIAAQMRRYAPQTVDERWEAQLASLGAAVWWKPDDVWLDAWGDLHGWGRADVVGCAIQVLCELGLLPELPFLGPPPGAARRSAAGPKPGHPGADSRVLDRVRALLAKAESTEFTEEADALTAKAQQLIAQYSIDEALLAARTGARDEPGGRRVGIDNPYEQPKALLLDAIAQANRCRAVWMKSFGFCTVVGFPSDVDAVELLYTSLLVQATGSMTREGRKQDRYGRSRTRSFRQSFLTAFAVRIRERLATATADVSQQAADATGRDRLLPVLAARTEAVDEATESMFPNVVAKPISANDAEGVMAGRAAADLASLRTRDEVAAGS